MGLTQEEENMTTPDSSGTPLEESKSKDVQIKLPAVVGDEKTLQMVVIALTLIALAAIAVSTYNGAIDAQTIVASVISGMAGLLGGQALRR